MTGYFDNRKKQKLYRQWMEKSGLPQDSIPDELRDENDAGDDAGNNPGETRLPNSRRGGVTLHLTTRHFIYLVYITVVLLVTTVLLATVLIMQSC